MSIRPVRAHYLHDLKDLGPVETRARLIEVKAAVEARLEELRDPQRRLELQIGLNRVNTRLLEASRLAVETLTNALSESHGEKPMPASNPYAAARVPVKRLKP
ncbi:hypothetical protein ACLBWX_18400 [Methylobacterium sp. M6A4_1b]